MDAEVRRRIEAARRKRERAQERERKAQGEQQDALRELAAALADARRHRPGSRERPPTADALAELAGLGGKAGRGRTVVHRLVKWHEAGAEGSPWKR